MRHFNIDENDEDDLVLDPSPNKRKHLPQDESARSTFANVDDPLWLVYSINPNLPFRHKVEKLLIGWNMTPVEIARVLKEEDVSRVEKLVEEIESYWSDLGAGLTDEARQKARGRMLAELQALKKQVEQLNEENADYKHLQLMMTILERMAKLRGIEIEKKETPPEEEENSDPAVDAINALSPDKLQDLYNRLNPEG